MRSGEIAFPILMKRWFSITPGQSIPALLWFRFMDLHFLLILGSVSLFYKYVVTPYGIPLLAIGLCLPLVFFCIRERISNLCDRGESRIRKIIKNLVEGIPSTMPLFWQVWFLTVFNWVIKLGVFSWLLIQFAQVSTRQSLFASLAGEFTSVFPIHGLAGVGTYEGGIVASLKGFGVNFDTAVQAAVNLHMFLLSSTILSGFIGLFLKKPHRGMLRTLYNTQETL
jgi:uncharacterized membrane protein YbhN (UPF0104 family)